MKAPLKVPPFGEESSEKEKRGQGVVSLDSAKGFSEDLNRTLKELFGLCLGQNRAKRVQEKREADARFNLKRQELEDLIREGMKDTGTAIKVYEKLSRLFSQVVKHRASVQYLVLNGIVDRTDKACQKAV